MQASDGINYEKVLTAHLKEMLKSHIRSSSKDNKLGALVAVIVERLQQLFLEMVDAQTAHLQQRLQLLQDSQDSIRQELLSVKAKNIELVSLMQKQAYDKVEEARAYSQTIDSLTTQLCSRQSTNQPAGTGLAVSKETGIGNIQRSDFGSFIHKRTLVRKQQKLSIVETPPQMPVLSSSSRVDSKDEKESRLASRYRKTSCSSEEELQNHHEARPVSKDSIDLLSKDKPINKGSTVFSRKNFSIFVTMDARMPTQMHSPTPHDAENTMIVSAIQSQSNQPILTNPKHKPSRSVDHPGKMEEGNDRSAFLQSASQHQQTSLRLEPAASHQTHFDQAIYSYAARRRPVPREPLLLTKIEAHSPQRIPGLGHQTRTPLPSIRPSRSTVEQLT